MYDARSFGMTLLLGVVLAVACVQPMAVADELNIDVDVTATTEVVSTYIWSIDKWADRTALTVDYGEEVPVNYCVTVDVCCADDQYLVSGDIYITNECSSSVDIYGFTVTISPGIPAATDCVLAFPYTLDEAETLTCSYSAVLPDDSARTVSVDVTANGYPGYQGTADVDFTGVVPEELDECVEVTDDYEGYLGSACVWEAPKTFCYTRMIGGSEVCGCDEVVNSLEAEITGDPAQITRLQEFGCVEIVLMEFFLEKVLPKVDRFFPFLCGKPLTDLRLCSRRLDELQPVLARPLIR